MKALALHGPGDLRLEERALPHPGRNQLVVRIDYVGVCGTDLEFFAGHYPPFIQLPMVLGHENAGTVVEVGEDTPGFEVGDRVLCGPPTACAEGCESCRDGRPNICVNGFAHTAGIGGPDGGFSEFLLIPDVAHRMLVKIPDGVAPEDAVLFDAACVALHGVRMSTLRVGDDVVISGSGPIGLSTVQFAKAAGARRIVALATSDGKEAIARDYGADHFINAKRTADVAAEVRRVLGRAHGADVVFETAGNPTSHNTSIDCVRPGGEVVCVGTINEPVTFTPGHFHMREPVFTYSFVYTRPEVEMFLDMLATHKVAFPGMVTDVMGLDDVVPRFFAAPDRRGQIKVLVSPNS